MSSSRLAARAPRRRPPRGGRSWLVAPMVAAVCALVAGLSGAPASAVRVDNWSVIGHRGFPRAGHTEDTIPSFAAAAQAGATAVELDLQLTRDRRMLVMHDSTLDRTTTCHGSVGARTLRHVLSHCRGNVAGERLPSVPQVLSWAKASGMNVILELKTAPADRWTVRRLGRLARLIRQHGLLQQVVVMSYSARFLAAAELADPGLETDWIARRWPGVETAARTADIVHLRARDLTVARVDALHAAGVRVFARVADTSRGWRRLDGLGVDGVLTGRPWGYLAWRASH